jgi:hypothetical protein
MVKQNKTVSDYYKLYHQDYDFPTQEELDDAVEKLKVFVDEVDNLGERFILFANELRIVLYSLIDCQSYRRSMF